MSPAKYKILRYFAYTVEILACFVIQQTPGLLPELFLARPTIILPVALSIAVFEQESASMSFGLLCGLLIDFGLGYALGFHALFLAVVCYAVSVMSGNLLKTNLLTAMLVALVCIPVLFLLQWVFYYVLFGYSYVSHALVYHYLPRMGYTLLFMPLFYYFNRAFALLIKPRED